MHSCLLVDNQLMSKTQKGFSMVKIFSEMILLQTRKINFASFHFVLFNIQFYSMPKLENLLNYKTKIIIEIA